MFSMFNCGLSLIYKRIYDLAIYGISRFEIQQTMAPLQQHITDAGLEIN